jgi:hypothetical protein
MSTKPLPFPRLPKSCGDAATVTPSTPKPLQSALVVAQRFEPAARLKLGKIAGGTPSVFIDCRGRLLAIGRGEARQLGLPYRRVKEWKAKLRAGTLPNNGAAVRRLKRALLADGGEAR